MRVAAALATPLLRGQRRTDVVRYRVPMGDTARRFLAGHRLRLVLASDDQRDGPAFSGFEHAPTGDPARQAIHSTSRLRCFALDGADALAPPSSQ